MRVFAREVGRYLDNARIAQRFDRLVLVAPPKFLGALRKERHKDLSWLNAREIERCFAKESERAP